LGWSRAISSQPSAGSIGFERFCLKADDGFAGKENDMRKILFGLGLLALASCAGGGLRYTYVEIESYPEQLQESIRRGEVMVGMTPIQVRYALGAPERSRTFSPEAGRIREEWKYLSNLNLKKVFVVFEKGEVVRIETEERKFPTIRIEEAKKETEKGK